MSGWVELRRTTGYFVPEKSVRMLLLEIRPVKQSRNMPRASFTSSRNSDDLPKTARTDTKQHTTKNRPIVVKADVINSMPVVSCQNKIIVAIGFCFELAQGLKMLVNSYINQRKPCEEDYKVLRQIFESLGRRAAM